MVPLTSEALGREDLPPSLSDPVDEAGEMGMYCSPFCADDFVFDFVFDFAGASQRDWGGIGV